GQVLEAALYFADGGDEGDSYDYDYPAPEHEWIIERPLTSDDLVESFTSDLLSELRVSGQLVLPADQQQRRERVAATSVPFTLTLSLAPGSGVLGVRGHVVNRAHEHRLRLGIRTGKHNTSSFAGGPFSIVERPCLPPEMAFWKERSYFEEPSATRPLLNHVSAVDDAGVITIHTRSAKEYEFVGDGYGDIELTVLRAVGFVGLPDLHRRPGRPSGMPERLLPAPGHQLDDGVIEIDFGIGFASSLDENEVFRTYAEFATNPLYGQNQNLDPMFYPISYFPLNPWSTPLDRDLSVLTIDDPNLSFGTVVESDRDHSSLVRLFNASDHAVDAGDLRLGHELAVTATTNLTEEERAPAESVTRQFTPGHLTTVVLGRREKE
ncbi:MAG: hypothetical protein ACTHKX_08980, partial [Pseudolysinimonas sp.]